MLSSLQIENVAIVERVEVVFATGLNLLTGETGAGKSIVIDALGAVTGARTSREIVRTGAQTARLTACFEDLSPEVLAFLRDNGFEDEDGMLILSRDISADGRNVCRVAGRVATVAQLRALGEQLLQIHGQHENQTLLSPVCHLALLDRFGELLPLLSDYQTAHQAWKENARRLLSVTHEQAERARRVSELKALCEELEEAALAEGEEDELLARRDVLQNAEAIASALGAAEALLLGDEAGDGALPMLSQAVSALEPVAAFEEDLTALFDKLKELTYNAEDAVTLLNGCLGGDRGDARELEDIEARMDELFRLRRRYGRDIPGLIALLQESRDELDELLFTEKNIEALQQKCEEACGAARRKALKLSEARAKAAKRLEAQMRAELEGLDMGKVVFQVELLVPERSADGSDLRESGLDEVQFLMSTNVGEPPRPIARIASGGELSRIMLAMQNIFSQSDSVGTLVFDEIDTGVSGRAAGRVAEKLAHVSKHRQVLCVTHLPQIAAMADAHFLIEKDVQGERTRTDVRPLDETGRIEEISRLLGGLTVTEITKSSARELTEAAHEFKISIR